MVIKELSPAIFDIFLGHGWENWLRVERVNKGRNIKVLAQADHIEVTKKLEDLVYFKVKKFIGTAKND